MWNAKKNRHKGSHVRAGRVQRGIALMVPLVRTEMCL